MKYRKPYRVKRKKSILKNRFFWLGILFLIIIGGIAYFLIFAAFFQIKEIQISGNEKVQRGDLEDFTWERIDRKIFVFETKSIFLTNLSQIEKNLSEKFPQISQVEIKRKLPDILQVEIQERKPLFIFCKDSAPCFSLDKEGVIFKEISETEAAFLRIKDLRPQEIYLGKKVIESNFLDTMREIESKLRDNFGILIPEISLFEEKIEAKTNQDFLIYFNRKGEVANQIQNLSLVFEKEIPPEKRQNLEYIDLRFGNRVYYKYRQ